MGKKTKEEQAPLPAVIQHESALACKQELSADDVTRQVQLIKQVQQAVMKVDVHYGVIKGCKVPSLLKAGAEKLCLTFRMAPEMQVEDLSAPDCSYIRYRVTVRLLRISDGAFLGSGIGECSSMEEKYRWHRTYSQKEWDSTPENLRRIKYTSYEGKDYEQKQIVTPAFDIGNTILKMAKKRGLVDAALTCTAASDIFVQDLEELDETIREHLVNEDVPPGKKTQGKPQVEQPKEKETKPKDTKPAGKPIGEDWISPNQISAIQAACKNKGIDDAAVCKEFKVDSVSMLDKKDIMAVYKFIGNSNPAKK